MIRELIEMFLLKKKDKDYDSYRDERIYIRVTKDEKDIIRKLAKCQCLDTSNFVRWLIFGKYLDDFIK
ncbi:hypothetical protein [Clostridium beijerinckii]|uniref:Uncharacterized protein n=1 Tax=Clostridium beijerinckii TaxID=1520 RepID=A0AAE5H0V5_CLOBE|nr:hypothetical protein [Clostridium beijerinckii]NSB12125.1 hypothetical protein [Clostridium beijerinckii]OOM27458.1 hypothetical protein CLOBE_30160 [Clostridium beijerinckii]